MELAERVTRLVPSIEKVRFVSSGTEATMSALRLARGFTGRRKILKFEGCYHGHADALLVAAGSGVATLGIPGSPGVPEGTVADTVVAPVQRRWPPSERVFAEHGADLAAVIVEPVAGNMGCVPPRDGYLPALRELTRSHGALLIFDEVITGFRLGAGRRAGRLRHRARPDLPGQDHRRRAARGGLRRPGRHHGPRRARGPVYQAGTLSGNPLAMAAGAATLDVLERPGTYARLEALTDRLAEGLRRAAAAAGVAGHGEPRRVALHACSSAPAPSPTTRRPRRADTAAFARFFHAMLERGVYLPPAQFEAAFVSLAHTEADVDATIAAARDVFASALQSG